MERQQAPKQQSPTRRSQVPENALDFNLAILNNEWGKESISEDLQEKLVKESYFKNEDTGEVFVDKKYLWGLLGFYTRDMRLGNLSPKDFEFCAYFIDLAGDFLQSDMIEPFIISLSRAITRIELSQSKGGFLRKQNNTLTSEHVEKAFEPQKKSLLGGKAKS